MLCLRRRKNERIVVDHNIVINVLEITRKTVLLGLDAPASVGILREELVERAAREGRLGQLEETLDRADNQGNGKSDN